MDWSICVICSECGPALKCPADSYANNASEVYATFLKHVSAFKQLNALPVNVDFRENGSVHQFMENKAKWHKACHLKFSHSKLLREQRKRGQCEKRQGDKTHVPIQSLKRLKLSSNHLKSCMFCAREDGKLHECAKVDMGCLPN
jgi:hypothetical protein